MFSHSLSLSKECGEVLGNKFKTSQKPVFFLGKSRQEISHPSGTESAILNRESQEWKN